MSDPPKHFRPSIEVLKVLELFGPLPRKNERDSKKGPIKDDEVVAVLKQWAKEGNEKAGAAALSAVLGKTKGRPKKDNSDRLRKVGWLLVSGKVDTLQGACEIVSKETKSIHIQAKSDVNNLLKDFREDWSKYIREGVVSYITYWGIQQRVALSQAIGLEIPDAWDNVNFHSIPEPRSRREYEAVLLSLAALEHILGPLLSTLEGELAIVSPAREQRAPSPVTRRPGRAGPRERERPSLQPVWHTIKLVAVKYQDDPKPLKAKARARARRDFNKTVTWLTGSKPKKAANKAKKAPVKKSAAKKRR